MVEEKERKIIRKKSLETGYFEEGSPYARIGTKSDIINGFFNQKCGNFQSSRNF